MDLNRTGSPLVGTPTQYFGTSRGYNDALDTANLDCNELFRWSISEEPACSETAQIGVGGNSLDIDATGSIGSEVVRVDINGLGYVQCTRLAIRPGIDICMTVYLRQTCDPQTGQVGPIEYRIVGSHDEFPWHELYLNGQQVYIYNPCVFENGPSNLWGGCAVGVEKPAGGGWLQLQ